MHLRVLVVDDLEFMRRVICDILLKEGYEIIGESTNGAEAVRDYKNLTPDLVLLDITMPVMDGLTALHRIRKYDTNAKVVMCSSLGQQKYIIRAIQLGAKDFVVKPFSPERILSAVKRVNNE